MRERSTSAPRPRVFFRIDRADKVAANHGLHGVVEKARFFGVTHMTWSRVVTGGNEVGEAFIAAVLTARPEQTFESLFTVERKPRRGEVAA